MMKHLRKYLQNDFVRNTLTLFSGSAATQLIPLIFTPVLTRLYPSEAFGTFFLFTSLSAILVIIVTLRYELAVVLPAKEEDAINILALGFLFIVVLSSFFAVLLIIFYDEILYYFHDNRLGNWLYLLPVSIFFLGIFQMLTYWGNRIKEYKHISYAKVSRSSSTAILQLIFGIKKLFDKGLITGIIFGHAISATQLFFTFFSKERDKTRMVKWSRMKDLARKYANVPLYNTMINLINSLSNHLPILLLAKYFGVEAAAYYGLTIRVIGTPVTMLGQSVGQVFYREAAEYVNKGRSLTRFVNRIYLKLFQYSLGPFVLVVIFGPFLFTFIFGDEWGDAGQFARYMVPWMMLNFMNVPVSAVITVLKRQKQVFYIMLILLLLRFGGLFAGYYFLNDVLWSVILFSVISFGYHLFMIVYYKKIVAGPVRSYE